VCVHVFMCASAIMFGAGLRVYVFMCVVCCVCF